MRLRERGLPAQRERELRERELRERELRERELRERELRERGLPAQRGRELRPVLELQPRVWARQLEPPLRVWGLQGQALLLGALEQPGPLERGRVSAPELLRWAWAALEQRGFSAAELTALVRDNPARLLS